VHKFPGKALRTKYILFQRKSGGYRQPTSAARLMSVILENYHKIWFQQIWEIGGASTKQHPAPYPLALAERLIRMSSFVGDTVLDPFIFSNSVNEFWGTRERQADAQRRRGQSDQGSRNAVTGGKQMDGFSKISSRWQSHRRH